MSTSPGAKRFVAAMISLILATAICSEATEAGADNTVYLAIYSSGTVTAELVEGHMQSVEFSTASQLEFGVLTLRVSDLRGTAAGWSVNIISSNFTYEGDSPTGRGITAEMFQIRAADAPQLVAGQPIDAGGPNFDLLLGASLDTSRAVLWAAPGSGSGDYEQAINVIWHVPANAQSGTYSAILTVTILSAP